MLRLASAVLVMAICCGCANQGSRAATTPEKKEGVQVNAPGVDVKVGPDGKTDVRAPGVTVKKD